MFTYLFVFLSILLGGAPQQQPSPDVILVTIDGTRWQEIFNGTELLRDGGKHIAPEQLVPNLYNYFVNQGMVIGKESPIIASGPNHVSLPGYLEITRGHPSVDCQNNLCRPIIDQSVFWFFKDSAVFSSWATIKQTLPVNSNIYSNTGVYGYRFDKTTISLVNTYLQTNHPDFLWVALGDTDEFAHMNIYSKYIESLHSADIFIGSLVERFPNSTIIVTTDHGRNAAFAHHGTDKDSERVWLMMRGPSVPHSGFVKALPLSLSNIMPTIVDIEFGTHSPSSILSKIY